MDVKQIIKEYLKANGFDGLYSDECGCKTGDLFPCPGDIEAVCDCKPGYFGPCIPEVCSADGDCDWHIGPVNHEIIPDSGGAPKLTQGNGEDNR